MFRQTHPSMWEFIDTLKLDAQYNQILIAQMLAGAAQPTQKGPIVIAYQCSYRNTCARVQ